jgi:DNA-binding GntR family transcriptional regulator
MALSTLGDGNVSTRVTDQIRASIHALEFAPGERLIERKLADMLGVSHIPVREALTRLADEGLVERLPRRGARVASLDGESLSEIASLRIVLEQFVVTRVQERWTSEIEVELSRLVGLMMEAAEKQDSRALFDYDREFHEALWTFADHRLLTTVAGQLRSRINGFLWAANAALESDGQVAHAMAHASLLEAIAGGDRATATAAMAEHIEASAGRIATPATD